jgi:hypothetical protein
MAMFVIAGGFRIIGAQPDGDSIHFTANDPTKWDLITGLSRDTRNCPVTVMRTARWWPRDLPVRGHLACAGQVKAFTPLPAIAWDSRMLSPLVWQRWAWCRSRSTVAVASVLGISSSNPAGCRLELIAIERFS